jgi:hypothetical protein
MTDQRHCAWHRAQARLDFSAPLRIRAVFLIGHLRTAHFVVGAELALERIREQPILCVSARSGALDEKHELLHRLLHLGLSGSAQ